MEIALTGWLVSLDLRKPHTDASSTTEITTPYALTFCCRGKNLKNHKHVQWVEITNCPPTKKTHGYIDAHTQKFRYSVIFMLFTVWLLNLVTVGLEFEKFEPPRTESPQFES